MIQILALLLKKHALEASGLKMYEPFCIIGRIIHKGDKTKKGTPFRIPFVNWLGLEPRTLPIKIGMRYQLN